MLPMIKLGGLVARTLTKPLAKKVKSRAKVDPRLNAVCLALGQRQHRLSMQLHMGFRGIANYTIKDLPVDQAVEQGADLIGEVIIFGVALGAASLEYSRTSAKSREKERIEHENRVQAERELEARFEYLETQVQWLEEKLGEVAQILEDELGSPKTRTMGSSSAGKGLQAESPLEPRRRRDAAMRQQDEHVHVGIDIDDKTAQSLSTSIYSAVTGSYNAIAALFK